jgi:hypothetical protein
MLAEFLSAVLDLRRPETVIGHGLIYSTEKDGGLTLVNPPMPSPLNLTSLSGFVDAAKAGVDGCAPDMVAVHVENYKTVKLTSLCADNYGQRQEFLISRHSNEADFRFGQYMEPEAFIIAIQAGFRPTDNLTKLVMVVSSLSAQNSVQTADDGISQRVTVQKGAVQRGTLQVDPRIALEAYRTFPEAEQPETEFLLRMRGEEGKLPQVALFEVDGGAWKQKAMLLVSSYLRTSLPEFIHLA